MTFIKFCGMTREQDVAKAVELGVNAVGFILWPGSPRHVDHSHVATLVSMLPKSIMPVGVFVDPTRDTIRRAVDETGIRIAQIYGTPVPPNAQQECDVWVATSLDHQNIALDNDATIVLDAHDPQRHGGTGTTIDWPRAAQVAATRRVMLAGGLNPSNVAEAIRRVRPFGVDVASGIEDSPGVKNADAMRAFVAAVRDEDR